MPLRLERLSLSRRTSLALGAVMVAASIVAVYILVSIRQLDRSAENQVRAVQALQAAAELEVEALEVMLSLRRYRDSEDTLQLVELERSRSAAQTSRQVLRERSTLPEVVRTLDAYEVLLPRRIASAEVIIEAVRAGDATDRLDEALAERELLDAQVTELLDLIVETERANYQRLEATAQSTRRAFRRNVLTTIAVALALICTLLYSIIAGGVTRRLSQLTDMARRVAAGDYSRGTFREADDEIAVLSRGLNDMASQLAQFDKVKEEFVALAAHQLRTPATAVKANLGMLTEGYCGELTTEQLGVLRDADESNERQLDLIEDLLFVARTDTGRLVLSKSTTDLASLAAHTVNEVRPTTAMRRQSLELDVSIGETLVDVDAQKMRMVIDNLVGNASKYTPEGGRIRVALARGEGSARLTVADSGVGIAVEDLPKLFKKFSRVTNPLSDAVGGTGLGLYLANEIVKLHGGTIEVTSTTGVGSEFTVRLPRET